ncbi:EF1D factor, partial [Sakesphorus luctuosus]|nr:EF1D factor [Sakesphorus luctuosus]
MRTRKTPCPVDNKAWLDKPKSQESQESGIHPDRREAPPEPDAVNGICHDDPTDGESKGDLKKSRNGKKQRKRKRSPKAKSMDSKMESILAGMSADGVWLDKPLYDRAESAYREKLVDSWSRETPPGTEEFHGIASSKPSQDIPKPRSLFPGIPRCSHGSLSACHHIIQGVWINKLDFDKAEGKFMEKSQFFLPPNILLAIPSSSSSSRMPGTPDEGYGTALPTPATPGLAPGIPDSSSGLSSSEQPTVNGKPQISNWEVLTSEVWLEKSLYDNAERNFYEKMFPGNPDPLETHPIGIDHFETHPMGSDPLETPPTIPPPPGIPEELPSRFFLHQDSESVWLQKSTYDKAESRFFALEASRGITGMLESPLGIPSQPSPTVPAPEKKKMAVDYFLHDKIWFEKHKYDDAERRFYEQMNGPLGSSSRQQENGASTILRDIARARENIQKSLTTGSSTSGASGDQNELLSRISHLEMENQNLRSVVSDLQMAIFKLESRLNALEKSSHQPCPVPPTQKVEPFSVPSKKVELPAKKPEPAAVEEEEDDDDIDLFGSDDEEEDQEAAKVREERLRQYAEKKAKKPGLIAKSSILLDVKPWDDETDMAKMEECVRSIHMDGLVWGASKLVPVGYGIKKLQIQCVVEDEKVGTDILEEEITKFEDYVQSVDIAAFNKI